MEMVYYYSLVWLDLLLHKALLIGDDKHPHIKPHATNGLRITKPVTKSSMSIKY